MPLHFNFEKVDLSSLPQEDRDVLMETLPVFAYVCMAIGLRGPTSRNIDEFERRYLIITHTMPSWFSGDGHACNRWTPYFIRTFLVDKYSTNASEHTKAQFNKMMIERLADYTPCNYGVFIKRRQDCLLSTREI